MIKYLFVLLGISLLFVNTNAQIDTTFCNFNNIVVDGPLLPVPQPNITSKFQSNTEKTSGAISEEIREFYDGLNNFGLSIQTVAGNRVYSYSFYDTNELLFIEGRFHFNSLFYLSIFKLKFFARRAMHCQKIKWIVWPKSVLFDYNTRW